MSFRVTLIPLGITLSLPRGSLLGDSLFAHGVEFPCGGRGRCKGCKIRILEGAQAPTADDIQRFSPEELALGWRLSCCTRVEADLKIEIAQWEATILADDTPFSFTPSEGFGVAVDVGTTTLVAQLVDLRSGQVRSVRTALNPQARHGADIMSRIEFAVAGQQKLLTDLIRKTTGILVAELLLATAVAPAALRRVCLVGNTVMHHLFCGIDVAPLAHVPFESPHGGLQQLAAKDLGWSFADSAEIYFLPCLGSFVGSDILAGILATDLHRSQKLKALVDLGTNGEIVVGNSERILCASTAAGPAFEGARISMGMRATTGAISEVTVHDNQFRCRVLGNTQPIGVCGSGLVDATAACLDLGLIKASGRLAQGNLIPLCDSVTLSQRDIRELQFAKGAISAGLRILTQQWGATLDDLTCIYLAGAFGNYIKHASARRIGLLPFPLEKIIPVGNSALLGAKMALFSSDSAQLHHPEIRTKTSHVGLNDDAQFQEVFAEEMAFPIANG